MAATGEPSGPATMASAASFPRYEEMISAAIEALNDKNGCSRTEISDYMDSTYGDLPPAHSTLLSHHLDKMSQSGELTVLNDNYFKPAAAGAGATAPQKRGRGRPPKPKTTPPPGAVAGPPPPPRPRGRPPKSRDPFAPPPPPKKAKTATSSGKGRPRGRPPKKDKVDVTAVGPVAGTRRSRGRPPKVKPAVAAVRC